jgi:hypothetical protein
MSSSALTTLSITSSFHRPAFKPCVVTSVMRCEMGTYEVRLADPPASVDGDERRPIGSRCLREDLSVSGSPDEPVCTVQHDGIVATSRSRVMMWPLIETNHRPQMLIPKEIWPLFHGSGPSLDGGGRALQARRPNLAARRGTNRHFIAPRFLRGRRAPPGRVDPSRTHTQSQSGDVAVHQGRPCSCSSSKRLVIARAHHRAAGYHAWHHLASSALSKNSGEGTR